MVDAVADLTETKARLRATIAAERAARRMALADATRARIIGSAAGVFGVGVLGIKFVVWVTDLDDGSGSIDWRKSSPSITKAAGAAVVAVALYVAVATLQVTAAINAMVFAGISTLFGRSMWKLWLNRGKWSAEMQHSRQEVDVHIEETRRIITERRDPELGIEATP